MITNTTYIKSTNQISIAVLLTNKSRCFYNTATFETGLNGCHKLIIAFFKAYFKKLPQKNIEYRNHKNFSENNILYELDQELSKGSIYKQKHCQCDVFTNTFRVVLDEHDPIKKKIEVMKHLF